ncbi:hypothetical protein GF357_03265 [Candidatus Dojkabacteria bacterium]|nr:hypothetical protein [Candidatus Dojkabacteria bacterium]
MPQKEQIPKAQLHDHNKRNQPPATNSPSPKRKQIVLIIVLILAILFMCGAITLTLTIWLKISEDQTSSQENSRPEATDPASENKHHTFSVESNVDYSNELIAYYEDIEILAEIEKELETSAQNQDPDAFFDSYNLYTETVEKQILRIEAISDYIQSTPNQNTESVGRKSSSKMVFKTRSKDRETFWYNIPIFGSLLRAKHNSIEKSRNGVYTFMKNELTESERNEYLVEYKLSNVDEIKNASDSKV